MAATQRPRLHDKILAEVKRKEFNEASLLTHLSTTAGTDGKEAMAAVKELFQTGALIAKFVKGGGGKGGSQKRVLCALEHVKMRDSPIVLKPRLDMSRRITRALFTYCRLTAEVSEDELKALCMQVYRIERYTPADFRLYFGAGMQRAIAAGKIEVVPGPDTGITKYRSGDRKPELMICALCNNNHTSSDHTKKLACINCGLLRHSSCMGMRKFKFKASGGFECELCADCADCKQPPSAWNPLAWCTACYRPKHRRPCDEQGDIAAAATTVAADVSSDEPNAPPRPLLSTCVACGGSQLVEPRPQPAQPPTTPKIETESFSPLAATCSSASSTTTTTTTTTAVGGEGGGMAGAPPGSSEKLQGVAKLSDSLTAYFTPSCEGRRRHKQINTQEDSTSDEEPGDGTTRHMHPLTVEVSGESGGSGLASKTPPSSASSSQHHHPHKRAEQQLQDALSPYFSASPGKRRSAVKGEYARMQGGSSSEMGLLSPGPGPGPSSASSSGHHHHQPHGAMMMASGGLLTTPKRSRGRPPRNPSLVGSPPSSAKEEHDEEGEGEEGEETGGEARRKMTAASSSSPRKSHGGTGGAGKGGGRAGSPLKKQRASGGEEQNEQQQHQWRLGRSTQNSASAALFSSPDDERRGSRGGAGGGGGRAAGGGGERSGDRAGPSGRRDSESDGGHRRMAKSARQSATTPAAPIATPKSPLHKRLKRELRSSEEDTSQQDSEDSDDKPLLMRRGASARTSYASATAAASAANTPSTSTASAFAQRTISEKKNSKKRKDDLLKQAQAGATRSSKDAPVRTQSPIDSTGTGAGSSNGTVFEMACGDMKISAEQWAGYEACSKRASEGIDKTALLSADGSEIPRWPETICFGRFEMETWFTAPYPSEYSHTKRLFICEFCLKYMKTLSQLIRHAKKCDSWHPPGNEIYRKDDVSVFEVDGNVAGAYCQNLCLLAKLYLDHKTLYYDVEPFLFYIVTKNDERGCHFVGYFSKEKYSAQKFNLSCIVTLPAYHKQGFGRFLIDFSYLLTRREKMFGTPERPLSDLGRVSYAAYWKSALLEYMRKKIKIEKKTDFRLSEIAVDTGISLYDAVEVMEALGMLVKNENTGSTEFIYKDDLVEAHWKKAQANKERIWIDERALEWTPTQYTPSKDFNAHLRSPPRVVSPTPSHHGVTPSGVPVAACGSTIKRGPLAAANAGPAGAAAAVAAGASSPTRKMTPAAAARMNDKKKATRQLKLTDCGIIASPKATSTPARKSRRIAAASEDSQASTSSDEEKKPETKTTCKPDSTKRRNKRNEESDSSDEEREGGGASPKKRPSGPQPGPSSASNGRRASSSRAGAAPSSSAPKNRKRGAGMRRDSDDDEEGEVSSVYSMSSSSSDSDSDKDNSFRPSIGGGRRPAPSKGKKGSKGGKPTPNIPKKGKHAAAPQKGGGKKNGAVLSTVAAPVTTIASSSPPVMVNAASRKKELKSPGKVFPANYLQTIAARKQAATAAAESAAAPGCSSTAATVGTASIAFELAAAAGEEDGRPASPADSLCSTATIPMRQAPDAADQSMMTDDAHESEGREITPGPSASAMSSRPSSSGRGRKLERRKNGRTRRGSSDDAQSESSVASSCSSLFRATSPRPMGDRVPSTSGGTMNMGWDEEETDHDRTMRMEQMADNAAPPASSSSSERPPSLQAMLPMEQGLPEEPPQPTLGSLLSHEMAKGGGGGYGVASTTVPPLLLQVPRKHSSNGAVAAIPQAAAMMMNGVGKPGPSGISACSSSSAIPPLAVSATADASATDDSDDDAPPCLSPQYGRGEGEGEMFAAGGSNGMAGGRGGCGASSGAEDGGTSSDTSAAPILAAVAAHCSSSMATRSHSLDHSSSHSHHSLHHNSSTTPSTAASASSTMSGGSGGSGSHGGLPASSQGGLGGGRRISEQSTHSCAVAAAAAAAAYDTYNTPPKAPLPHADQLLRPALDAGVSHQELNFGMAAHSLHGRLSGGEGGPGPPPPGGPGGPPGSAHSAHSAQTSPLLLHHQQQQQQQHLQTNMMMQQQQHGGTPQMMTYPGSASGGGMQSTPGSVPSTHSAHHSAHNTPESAAVMQQQQQCGGGGGGSTPLMQQQQQQHQQVQQQMQQQFTSPPMQQMYSQQPSSVHSTNSGHHDMSGGGGGGGPGSVPAGYGLQMHQGGHSNPSTPLRAMGGPGSVNQPPFNSPTPMQQPMSVPDHHAAAVAAQLQAQAAACTAAAPSIAGRRSSEAASVGPPSAASASAAAAAAGAATAATKKRSSAGGGVAALPSPLAAQQHHQAQQQQQQAQQAQQYQMMQMMAMQNMQHMFPMYPNQMTNGYNGYMHAAQWPANAAFQQMAYPTGMMQMPTATSSSSSGKNGVMTSSTAAAATASLYPQYAATALQQMQQQQHQQQQPMQQQAQRVAAATAATAAAWQRTPVFGPPFPGVAVAGGAPDAGANFVLNGGLPAMQYFSQAAHPTTFNQHY